MILQTIPQKINPTKVSFLPKKTSTSFLLGSLVFFFGGSLLPLFDHHLLPITGSGSATKGVGVSLCSPYSPSREEGRYERYQTDCNFCHATNQEPRHSIEWLGHGCSNSAVPPHISLIPRLRSHSAFPLLIAPNPYFPSNPAFPLYFIPLRFFPLIGIPPFPFPSQREQSLGRDGPPHPPSTGPSSKAQPSPGGPAHGPFLFCSF